MTAGLKPCLHTRTHHDHGTRNAYTLDGCRCPACGLARSLYQEHLHHRRMNGQSDYVDAAPARARLAELRAAGIGTRRISAVTGVSRSALRELAGGAFSRVHRSTAQRIMQAALTPAEHALVPAVGAARRVRALIAVGWSVSRVAAAAGVDRQALDPMLDDDARQILAATAQAIAVAYDRLWDAAPPHATTPERQGASRARRRAARAGWVPPAAWDDDDIDDPGAKPAIVDTSAPHGVDDVAVARAMSGESVHLTRAERWVAVERLAALGKSDRAIAERLHVTDMTILRDRQTLGIESRWSA